MDLTIHLPPRASASPPRNEPHASAAKRSADLTLEREPSRFGVLSLGVLMLSAVAGVGANLDFPMCAALAPRLPSDGGTGSALDHLTATFQQMAGHVESTCRAEEAAAADPPTVCTAAEAHGAHAAGPSAHEERFAQSFIARTVKLAIDSGVTQFYFAELHGDPHNLEVAVQLLRAIRLAGGRARVCREDDPDREDLLEPMTRDRHIDAVAEHLADFDETQLAQGLDAFRAEFSEGGATPCWLVLLAGHEDLTRFVESRPISAAEYPKAVEVASLHVEHALGRRVNGYIDRPWSDATLLGGGYETGDDRVQGALFNAFPRRQAFAPGSAAVLVSSDVFHPPSPRPADSPYDGNFASLDRFTQFYVDEGFAVAHGELESLSAPGTRAGLHFVLPGAMSAGLQAMKADIPPTSVQCDGLEACRPANFPHALRQFIGSAIRDDGIRKIFVARGPYRTRLDTVTGALRGAADSVPANAPPGVTLHCQMLDNIAADEADIPDRRGWTAERLAWEVRNGTLAEVRDDERVRFEQSLRPSSIVVHTADFRTDPQADLRTFLDGDGLAVASLASNLAVEGFRSALAKGIPALLLLEDETTAREIEAAHPAVVTQRLHVGGWPVIALQAGRTAI